VELLQTPGWSTSAAINLFGNERANTIAGNAAANLLDGRGGADTMYGMAGNDTYLVDNTADRVFESVGNGVDTVRTGVSFKLAAGARIEVLQTLGGATTAPIDLTGNEFANTIYGNAGANKISGGFGADTLVGLNGNDRYLVDNAGDRIVEVNSGGIDEVRSSVSYTLTAGAQVEILQTTDISATAAIHLTGNEFANTVAGNAANNRLIGGGSADILMGLGGNDNLTGGAGNDVFRFITAPNGTSNVDRITDFSAPNDTIQLLASVFTALQSTGGTTAGVLAPGQFHIGTAAHDGDDRIIYNSTNGVLIYDANGNAAGGALWFATVGANLPLTNADFVLI
jgi:Ca2+-binding RTX toxin-like protein